MSNKTGAKAEKKSVVLSKPPSKKNLQPKAPVKKASKPTAKASTAKTKPEVEKPVKNQEKSTKGKPKRIEAKKELSGLSVKLMGDGISIRWSIISKEFFDSLTKKGVWEKDIWKDFFNDCKEVIGGNANESCYAEIDHKKLIPTDFNQMFIGTEANLKFMREQAKQKKKLISIDSSQKPSHTTSIKVPKGKYLLVRIGGLKGDYVSMSNPDGKTIKESFFKISITRVIAPDGWIYNVASLRSKNNDYLADDDDFYYWGTERYGWDVYDSTGKRHEVKFNSRQGPKTICDGMTRRYWEQPYEGQEKEIAKSRMFSSKEA